MAQRQPIRPNNLRSPVYSRARGGPSWRATPNRTPLQDQQQRKIQPVVINDYDYSYSDSLSDDENIQVVKVSSNNKKAANLLNDYSSDDDIVNVSKKIDQNIKKNVQTIKSSDEYDSYSNYSDSYSVPSPPNKTPNLSKRNLNETSFAPQKNQIPNTQPVEKNKFVRRNISNINRTPENRLPEEKNVQYNQNDHRETENDLNNQTSNNQRKKRRVIRENHSEQKILKQPNLVNNADDTNISRNIESNLNVQNNNNVQNNIANGAIISTSNYNNGVNNNNNPNTNLPPASNLSKLDDKFHHFTVTREIGKLGRLKTHLFTNKSKVYIRSKDKKNIDRKVLHYFAGEPNFLNPSEVNVISRKHSDKFSIDESIAYLKWNKKLTRFALYCPQVKDFRDDRRGELLGAYVDTNSDKMNVQHGDVATKSYLIFTVVIPSDQKPVYPISERLTLVEMAKAYSEISNVSIKKASSSPLNKVKKSKKKGFRRESEINMNETANSQTSMPNESNIASSGSFFNGNNQNTNSNIQASRKIDPRFIKLVQSDLENIPEEELGNIFYQKSAKNFAFVDESTGKPLFLFFKSSKNAYSIKVRPPMLPLQAHALAVIILKRNMQWQFV